MTEKAPSIMLPQTLLRRPAVLACCGLARSSLYARINAGLWPKPVNLGGRAVAWPANEIAAVNAARIANKSNEEVRQLVTDLEAARKTVVQTDETV